MVLQRRDWKSARIALISVDGTNYRELATDVVRTPTLEWTPDGRGLLAVQQRGDGKELVQVLLDGSAPKSTGLALREPEMHSFDLTPEGRLIFSDRTRDDVAGKLWAYDNILSLLP